MTARYTIKDGQPYAYDENQDDLYEQRISEGGHVAATLAQVQALTAPKLTAEVVKAAATAKRWAVETGGITLPSGVRVGTGTDDQNRITTVIANGEHAGVQQVDFKAASGWVTLSMVEIKAIAGAIATHVQACFSAERAHHEAIDALAAQHAGDADDLHAALEAYNIHTGWPM